jgi:uroporphyrinogen decarboxylase
VNAKQNALEVIRFGRPEYLPWGVPFKRIAYLGCDHHAYDGSGGHQSPVGSHWTDIWGTVWYREHEGVMGFPRGNPLADFPDAMRGYRWPDPNDERICARIYKQAEQYKSEGLDNHFLMGAHRDLLWEKAYMLVGMENLMCAFIAEPQATRELLHRITEFQLGIARHYAAVGVEMIACSDDLGMQTGPLLSPQIVADFFVPEYRRVFSFHKQRGTLVNFHCCGHVMHMLETFIEIGVDILNSVQASANNLGEMRRVTQGRLALEGAVDSSVIVAGPPERIRRLVRSRMWQLGRNGGYFCGPDQGMPWPKEHIEAARQAAAEYGAYPLRELAPEDAEIAATAGKPSGMDTK